MSGVRITRMLLEIDATAEVSTYRTKAVSLRPGDPATTPSHYALDIGRALDLKLADEATVRMLRDACDRLLALPAPDEVLSLLPARDEDD
jgi:hypothetical protein